jgi:hypothetical protein
MSIPIETRTGISSSAMMDHWRSHQDAGYNSQPRTYPAQSYNVPIPFAPRGGQQQQQQSYIPPRQPQIASSAHVHSGFVNPDLTNEGFADLPQSRFVPVPPNATQISPHHIALYGSMGPPPFRNPQAPDQRHQDEMDVLMMGAPVTQSVDMGSSQLWSSSQLSPEPMFQVDLAGSLWQRPTPPPLVTTPTFMAPRPVTPLTRCSPDVEWMEEWKRNSQSTTQPIQASRTMLGESSLAVPIHSSCINEYNAYSFGSYSERSEMERSFSPATPTTFPFGPYDGDIRVRRDSEEQQSFQNMPVQGFESNPMHGQEEYPAQTQWPISHPSFDGYEQKGRKPSQHIQPRMPFPQPHTILLSQVDPRIPPPTKVAEDLDFGSPDPEDDDISTVEGRVVQPAPEPSQRRPRAFVQQQVPRDRRDELLVELRREGFSYKDIKRKGGYEEAESTLRGRFRTLTKPKQERVRRPDWTEQDVSIRSNSNHMIRSFSPSASESLIRLQCRLLGEAVVAIVGAERARQASDHDAIDRLNVAWKDVALYIVEKGGSYHFGNATCKKKWCEIQTNGH